MLLYHKKYGHGHPLIILHGLLGTGSNWHTLSSKTFAKHFEVYAVDLRNHGHSPHREEFDYPSMAADIDTFVAFYGLAPVYLMGHSMGGMTAMHVALTYPDIVEKLIVVDMAPKPYEAHYVDLFRVLGSLRLNEYKDRRALNAALKQEISSDALRHLVLQNIRFDRATESFDWKVHLEGIINSHELLNKPLPSGVSFTKPTLFIRGGNSKYFADDDIEIIRPLFPAAQVVTIPNAGHWVHADTPQAFGEAVFAFLQMNHPMM